MSFLVSNWSLRLGDSLFLVLYARFLAIILPSHNQDKFLFVTRHKVRRHDSASHQRHFSRKTFLYSNRLRPKSQPKTAESQLKIYRRPPSPPQDKRKTRRHPNTFASFSKCNLASPPPPFLGSSRASGGYGLSSPSHKQAPTTFTLFYWS